MGWRHSGFNVHCGPTIWPESSAVIEDLWRYIVRACFSRERLRYLPATETMDGQVKVIYTAKDGHSHQSFTALDWLAPTYPTKANRWFATIGSIEAHLTAI